MENQNSKQKFLNLIEEALESELFKPFELQRYLKGPGNSTDPDYLTYEMEAWYKDMGLEYITGEKLTLSTCPFTPEEIEESQKNDEIIMCVPKGVTREQLGKLFRLDSWALHDPMVTPATETEDCWFRTSKSMTPVDMKATGVESAHKAEDEKLLNFSIERYIAFIGRMRYLTGKTPDMQYWIWLPRGRYDRSGMLVAGFDRNGVLNVHGWMPQFYASFLGARFGIPAKSKVNFQV